MIVQEERRSKKVKDSVFLTYLKGKPIVEILTKVGKKKDKNPMKANDEKVHKGI